MNSILKRVNKDQILKESDLSLRENKEKFKTIFENVRDVIAFIDKKGKILDISPNIRDIFGYQKEEVINKNFMKLGVLNLKNMPKIISLFKSSLTKGKVIPFLKLEIKNKQGHYIPIEASSQLIKKNGRIEGVLTTIRDITKQEKTEAELKMQARILKKMVEGVNLTDQKGNMIYTNPRFEAMFGYKPGELIGKHISLLNNLPPEENKQLVQKIIKKLKTNKSYSGEFKNKKKDGTSFITSAHISPLEQNHQTFWISVQEDITEKKKAEQKLKQSEQTMKAHYQNLPIPTYTWKKQGDNFVLFDYNYDASRITEGKIVDFIGKKLTQMYAPDSEISKDLKKCFSKKTTIKKEMKYTYKSLKKDKWLDVSYVFIPPDMVMVHTADIDDRKKAELEKEKLMNRTRENLILIQRQNVQLINLQKKLKEYSKKLESKVKKLEKIKLTPKEKIVFSALANFPDYNDQKLSQETKISRSTITAIKNRLKTKNYFKTINIPHHSLLGCELVSPLTIYFDQPLKELKFKSLVEKIKDIDEIFFITLTQKKAILFLACQNIVNHREIIDKLKTIFNDLNLKPETNHLHLPCEITKFNFFFDFKDILNQLFELKTKKQNLIKKNPPAQKLSKNQKKILYLLTKYPNAPVNKLTQFSGLTKITTGKIKKYLFDQNQITSKTIPNLKKLGYKAMVLHHFSPAGKLIELRKRYIEKLPLHTILDLYNDTDLIEISIYKESPLKNKYEEFINYRRNQLDINHKKFVLFLDEIKFQKLDFAPLLKKIINFQE